MLKNSQLDVGVYALKKAVYILGEAAIKSNRKPKSLSAAEDPDKVIIKNKNHQ